MSYYRDQLDIFIKDNLKDINFTGNVLDVGGAQLPISKRVNMDNANMYAILDLENPHDKGQKPDIVWDLNKGHTGQTPIAGRVFDTLFCFEVMEYIYNPIQALTTMRSLAKDGAELYITFPFVYPHHNPEEQDFLRYTEWGAKKILEETGWEINMIEYRQSLKDLKGFYKEEGMKLSKYYNKHNIVGFIIRATAI